VFVDLRGAALGLGLGSALGLAALIPAPQHSDAPRTVATLAWLAAGHHYIRAVEDPGPGSVDVLLGWLIVVHNLDPDYPRAPSLGTAMLRALERGDGPATLSWAARHPGQAPLLESHQEDR